MSAGLLPADPPRQGVVRPPETVGPVTADHGRAEPIQRRTAAVSPAATAGPAPEGGQQTFKRSAAENRCVRTLLMVGVSYRDAPFDLLERLAAPGPALDGLLRSVRRSGTSETVVVSTCCRTEIYVVADDGLRAGMEQRLVGVLAEHCGVPASDIACVARSRSEDDLVVHLLRVACGLESRLPGEVDVVAQVRAAADEARAAGTLGPELGRLFAAASGAARRVHRQTSLGSLGRSLGRHGAELGLGALVTDATDAAVVVLGTGKMAATVMAALTAAGVRPAVCGRNPARTARLAASGGSALPLDALPAALTAADLVICCTGASEPLLDTAQVGAVLEGRGGRPLTVVDLSLPRNVDRDVGSLPAVRLIDLETLGDDCAARSELSAALGAASAITVAETARFMEARRARAAGPFIAALRGRVGELCRTELRRLVDTQLLPAAEVDRVAATIAGKLLHHPTVYARRAAAAGDTGALAELGRMLLPTAALPPVPSVRQSQRDPDQPFSATSNLEPRHTVAPAAP